MEPEAQAATMETPIPKEWDVHEVLKEKKKKKKKSSKKKSGKKKKKLTEEEKAEMKTQLEDAKAGIQDVMEKSGWSKKSKKTGSSNKAGSNGDLSQSDTANTAVDADSDDGSIVADVKEMTDSSKPVDGDVSDEDSVVAGIKKMADKAVDALSNLEESDLLSGEVAEVLENTIEAAVDVVQAIPVFGVAIKTLHELCKLSKEAKQNVKACQEVHEWASCIETALVKAKPILSQDKDCGKSVERFFDKLIKQNESLLEMTRAFVDRSFMMKLLTTRAFSQKFEKCQATATKLLDKIQLLMSAQNLQIAYDTQMAIKNLTVQASTVSVPCDEKLDEMILNQQKMNNKMDDHHSKLTSKLDVLASSATHAERFTFQLNGRVVVKKGWFFWVPLVKGLKTKCKPYTKIRNITATPLIQDDFLTKKEWEWMNNYIQAKLRHKFDWARRKRSQEDVAESLTEQLMEAIAQVRRELKLKDRRIGLKSQDMRVETKKHWTKAERRAEGGKRQTEEFTAELILSFPSAGPVLASSDLNLALPAQQKIKRQISAQNVASNSRLEWMNALVGLLVF